jgi:secreted trypsin-like serine protease
MFSGTTADVKQTLSVPIVDWKTCDKQFPSRIISSAQVCAGGTLGKDACKGDSGGPLMAYASASAKSFFYLLGIVSYGPPCGTSSINPRPSVYAKVSAYIDWIEANVYE